MEQQQQQFKPRPPDLSPNVEAGFERTVKRYLTAWENRGTNGASAAAAHIRPTLHPANAFFVTPGAPLQTTQCPLCAVTLPTPDALRAHVTLIHPNAFCHPPPVAQPQPYQSMPVPYQTAPGIQPGPWFSVPVPPQAYPMPPVSVPVASQPQPPQPPQQHVPTSGRVPNRNSPFFCEVCEVQCDTKSQHSSHVEGQKHRKKAEIHKAFVAITNSFPREGITEISPGVWACIPCRVCLDGKTPVMQHLEAAKHKRNREAMNRQAQVQSGVPLVQQATTKSRKRLRTPVPVLNPVGVQTIVASVSDVRVTTSAVDTVPNNISTAAPPAQAVAAAVAQTEASGTTYRPVPSKQPSAEKHAAEKPAAVPLSADADVPERVKTAIGSDIFATFPLKKGAEKPALSEQQEDVKLTEVKLKEVELKDLLPPEETVKTQTMEPPTPAPNVESVQPHGTMSILEASALPKKGLTASVSKTGIQPKLPAALPTAPANMRVPPKPTSIQSAVPTTTPAEKKAGENLIAQNASPSPIRSASSSLTSSSGAIPEAMGNPYGILPRPPVKEFRCTTCNVMCNSVDMLNTHLASAKHKRKQRFQEGAQSSVENGSASMQNGAFHVEGALLCKVCNVCCSGLENFQAHLRGKLHTKKLRQNAVQAQHNG